MHNNGPTALTARLHNELLYRCWRRKRLLNGRNIRTIQENRYDLPTKFRNEYYIGLMHNVLYHRKERKYRVIPWEHFSDQRRLPRGDRGKNE